MSPSGSVSLSSTGRMVVLPARTPKVSGLAAGALLGLVRSGSTVCWTSSAESLSASSEVCCGGMTSSQLLTSCMFWLTSHTFPEFTSLRTTRSRFTRNTYDLVTRSPWARPRSCHWHHRRSPGHTCSPPTTPHAHTRPAAPEPPAHPARQTSPSSPSNHPTAASAAPSASPPPPHPRPDPDCCSFASRASANASSRPPGRNNFPRPASSTTGASPTTASCRSPAPFNPSQVLGLRRIRHRTLGIHRRHRDLPGLRIRTVNPVISTHRRHRPCRTRQHRLGILRIKTAHRRRRQRPHRALRRVRHRNDLRPETHLRRPRQLLIPAQPHLRRRHLIQRRTRTVIHKHRPGILQHIKRRRRRRHRPIQHPRRIIQPPHRILRLRHHPHTTIVQLHLSGLKPRIDDGAGDQHGGGDSEAGSAQETAAAGTERA